jgi:hypothetical protein
MRISVDASVLYFSIGILDVHVDGIYAVNMIPVVIDSNVFVSAMRTNDPSGGASSAAACDTETRFRVMAAEANISAALAVLDRLEARIVRP